MKNLKIALASVLLFAGTTAIAQEGTEETAKETTQKTYSFFEDGKKVENSVRITTIRKQAVMTEEEDKDKVNQTRKIPPKMIYKTVEIDKDSDDAFDEVIEFSYISESVSDFTLVSDKENILVAIEDGENLTIVEDMTISKNGLTDSKKSYVFTDKDGKEVEFYIKSIDWNKESK